MDHHTKYIIDRLKEMPSLDDVRRAIARKEFGDVGSPNHETASEWLRAEEIAVENRRKDESLSISRQALSNSRLATKIALAAIVLSIAMAIQKIVEWLSK